MMDERDEIPADDLPELVFFDTDDMPEEADFIRIDDLFRGETDTVPAQNGALSFVLFPRKIGQFIGSRLSLLIRRTMLLLAARAETPPERIRVRPMFVQWQCEPNEADQAETIVREIRAELETQAVLLGDTGENSRFWAGSCFVYPAENEYPDNYLNQLIEMYQVPAKEADES